MDSNQILAKFFDALVQLQIPSMLVGSYCSNFYGYASAGCSADTVVENGTKPLLNELAHFMEPEFKLKANVEPMLFILMHQPSAFWINLFGLSGDAHDQMRFQRRRPVQFLDRSVHLPTPEDVIITKLRWSKGGNRAKDVDNVRNVLAVQMDHLDFAYIHPWCDQHGTRELLDALVTNVKAQL